MKEGGLEPLDPIVWYESLERLRRPARGAEGRIENRLRQAYYLASLAPPPFSALAKCELDEAAFEGLLQREAFESAAISLIGRILSFEIVRAWPGPAVSARVWVEDVRGEATSASHSVAGALVQAWIEVLFQFSKRVPELASPARPTGRRRSRSGPPRKPILH